MWYLRDKLCASQCRIQITFKAGSVSISDTTSIQHDTSPCGETRRTTSIGSQQASACRPASGAMDICTRAMRTTWRKGCRRDGRRDGGRRWKKEGRTNTAIPVTTAQHQTSPFGESTNQIVIERPSHRATHPAIRRGFQICRLCASG